MNIENNDTRLKYDSCSYKETLKRTTAPGLYYLNTPYNDCNDCPTGVLSDPSLVYQNYGPATCTMKSAIDDSSELLGLNYKASKCNDNNYKPDTYKSTSGCPKNINCNDKNLKQQESTRLSNPPCTLKSTGINRWEWLCFDPQERALERFQLGGQDYRMISKDNHVPCIEKPIDQSIFFPKNNEDNELNPWSAGLGSLNMLAPGNPLGSLQYNATCSSISLN